MLRLQLLSITIAAVMLALPCIGFCQTDSLPDWALGPFIRPQRVNPILVPDAKNLFIDPMTNKKIVWESNDVFNPAATVKANKICVLYRAEDTTGIAIGTRTSRI
jgi:hypothetical protein